MKESRTLEFKQEISHTFLKTVSAFSNYNGGTIMFGIKDDGFIIGINDPTTNCLDIENLINANIDPLPDYSLQVDYITNVISLIVLEGVHKPYFYKNKAYIRNDTSTVEIDRLELTRLVLEGQNLNFEDLKSKKSELSFSVLESKLKDSLHIDYLNKDILKTLELYSDVNGYNNAALLLSDNNDFPGIDMVRFGFDLNILEDRKTLDNMSILKQLDEAISMFEQYYIYEKIDDVLRKKIELIPKKAFREAIANALVHRSYDINNHITVSMHCDRIEVVSSGGLPKGISKEEYIRGGISILRNPIIGMVFYRLNIIEKFGTGIRRIIECYKDSTSKPKFELNENSIRITLPLLSDTSILNKDEKIIIDSLNHRSLSISELSSTTKFSKSKVLYVIKDLINKGCVQITGNGRGTKYTLL